MSKRQYEMRRRRRLHRRMGTGLPPLLDFQTDEFLFLVAGIAMLCGFLGFVL